MYLCHEIWRKKKVHSETKGQDMATAIRPIPTLHGVEARDFEAEAQKVEMHPGTLKMSPDAVGAYDKMLKEARLR